MYPPGQSRNTSIDLDKILQILDHENRMLRKITVEDVDRCVSKLDDLRDAIAVVVKTVYDTPFRINLKCTDGE